MNGRVHREDAAGMRIRRFARGPAGVVAWAVFLVIPVLAYGYSVDIAFGDGGVLRLGDGVAVSAVEDEASGRMYATRLLPPGYAVRGYEVPEESRR